MRWIDKLPLLPVAVGAVLLGLAPFGSQPHLWEKLTMLAAGTLDRPLDIFDLLMHAALPVLLIIKLVRLAWHKRSGSTST
jgi:hypothetical protein